MSVGRPCSAAPTATRKATVTRSGSSSPVVRLITAFPDMAASHSRCPPYQGSLWSATIESMRESTGFPSVTADHHPTDLAVVGLRSAHRTSLEAVLEAPGEDPARPDPNDLVVEPLHDGLATGVERGRLAAHLHGPGLPWREHVVDHQRRHARPLDVAELLALGELVPADVDGVGLGVVAEGDGDDMGHAVMADRGQPSEPLAPEVLDLGIAEHAHEVLLLAGHSHDHSNTHNRKTRSDQVDGPGGGCRRRGAPRGRTDRPAATAIPD